MENVTPCESKGEYNEQTPRIPLVLSLCYNVLERCYADFETIVWRGLIMRRWHQSYYVSVRNRSPFGKMSVCNHIASDRGTWCSYVIVDTLQHAMRLTKQFPKKWQHIDLYEWKRGRLHRSCIWDNGEGIDARS